MLNYTLNSAQRQAVEYISGPLLIVAGAGTGKTSVITQKIAYLIENKLAKPEEILALTFTEKAAEEMSDRVDRLVNIGYADIQISTFHAFCEQLLQMYALDAGLPNRFRVLKPTEAWLLVRRNLDKFDLDYYRPLGNPTRHIHELIKHFHKCKDELISPQDYLNYAQGVQLDKDSIDSGEKNRLMEIANVYHTYNQLLLDKAVLDFADLIFYAIELLEKRPNVLEAMQKRFRYILVDEFQDVNWAQYKLVQMIAGEKNQLTMVGDDDQSIYAFRGASVSNILRFKDDYPQAKEIVLTENYRSGQKILDLAHTSIQNNNPDRLEVKLNIDKHLLAKNEECGTGEIEYIYCSNLQEEVNFIIDKISAIRAEKLADYSDFAILVRANAYADPFVNTLQKRGIPYEFSASAGLYTQPIVIDALNFLRAIDNYHESSAIYRLLQLPCWQFSSDDLQKLSYSTGRKSIGFYEALKRSAEFNLSDFGQNICHELLKLINAGMQSARAQKPTAVLCQFFEDSGYLKYLVHEEEQGNIEKTRQIFHLRKFFDYINEFEIAHAGARLRDFLEHYDYVLQSGDEGELYFPKEMTDSVNIMTMHGAKGLEFKYVFVVNLVEDRFPTRNRGDGIEIPLPLIKERLPEGDYHLEEERRLFYVAITRAKQGLFLTNADNYGGLRKKKISRFLTELGFTNNNTAMKQWNNSSSLHHHLLKLESAADVQAVKKLDNAPSVFSYSKINSYQRCPYQYKLAHVLSIPVKGNASLSFGQTLHSTLLEFYKRIQDLNAVTQNSLFESTNKQNIDKGNIKTPLLDELLGIYKKNWIGDWYESERQHDDYYKKGKEILRVFYEAQSGNWIIPICLESAFKVKVGDYLLSGRIDRIDRLADGTLEIIDYKTGTSKEKISGDDKDQLLLYQIAVSCLLEYQGLGKVNKLTYYYLNDNLRVSLVSKEDEIEKLIAKIQNTAKAIGRGDFSATPSPRICPRCDFKNICEFRLL